MRFPFRFDHRLVWVHKLHPSAWAEQHQAIVHELTYRAGQLFVRSEGWRTAFLGAGEEKAVFLLCDPQQQVFAIELIDERHYLNGRFVGGTYFHTTRVASLTNVAFNPSALIGLRFTGLVKAREFVYGYEWDRFQLCMGRHSPADRVMTIWLQSWLQREFASIAARYQDVHGRNILFELRPPAAQGVPCLIINQARQVQRVRVGLQPIDVR